MRQCTKCLQWKDEANFYPRHNSNKAPRTQCKACELQKRQQNRQPVLYTDSERSRSQQRHLAQDQWIDSVKQANPCAVCGESAIECLDFHHVDTTTKLFRLNAVHRRGAVVVWREVNKCCLLCANCHRKVHTRRINPILVPINVPKPYTLGLKARWGE